MSSSATRFCVCFALLAAAPGALAERNFSAYLPPSAKASGPSEALSAGVQPSQRLVLDAIPRAQRLAIREKNSPRAQPGAIQVGIVRDLPAGASTASARWTAVAGGHAMQWRVRVEGAAALRIALVAKSVPSGVRVRFASVARPGQVHGEALAPGLSWGPVLAGDEAIVELLAPAGVATRDVDVSLARVADHAASPLEADAVAKSQWLAASCEVDLACESQSDPVLARAGAASIKLNWVDGYSAYACSATLLNPADGSYRPYVYTAAHCIDSQAAADSLVTIWFYEKSTCGGEEARAAVQLGGGARLLVADAAFDTTLLRLNRMPPEGAVYAGWDSDPPALGESLVALHHANGEVTKVSHGNVIAAPPYPLFAVAWTSGIVQGGSSGSGAFSRVAGPDGDLLMRGGLSAANASCAAPGTGFYSRLDQVWPAIAPYLSDKAQYANATGLWWDAGEPGWGVSLNEQGDVAFGVLFTYAEDGRPAWLVASRMRRAGDGSFAGELYRASGGGVTAVGRMQVTLTRANEARLAYSVDGRDVEKIVTRQAFNGFAPVCTGTTGSRAAATSYQDLWSSPGEPGWGLGIAQQGDVIFATLFTHDESGRDTWLVASSLARTGDAAFSGILYRTSRSAGKAVKASAAGSLRLDFPDAEHATAEIAIDGRTATRRISRQVFGPTPPLCR